MVARQQHAICEEEKTTKGETDRYYMFKVK